MGRVVNTVGGFVTKHPKTTAVVAVVAVTGLKFLLSRRDRLPLIL